MFGYVRPLKDELKVREYEEFKSVYCALCHTLKSEYGAFAQNILSYDFAFLAMLLWDAGDKPSYKCARCVASPVRKRRYCAPSPVLELCAGYSVILTWWKLRDSIRDETFLHSLRDRLLKLLLNGAYKKASRRYTHFDNTVRENLDALSELETAKNGSLDACADKFARITEALTDTPPENDRFRPLQQLLYHTGRYVYIIDACDDLEEDLKCGRFNPIANRFGRHEGALSDEEKRLLKETLIHSCTLIATAYELLPENFWSPVLRNIIYIGMPETCIRVLNGTWNKNKGAENKGMDKII